jgi:ATP-binding cassette subfamily F protein uup
MIEWLEAYFAKENITLFMVTHDRFFERVCNEIIELDNGKLYSYKGNYSYYLEKKEERIASENSSVDKAQNLFVKELEWMRRQPKARTTKSKSRQDDFTKLKKKHKVAVRKTRWNLNQHGTWEARLSSFTKSQKNSRIM